MSLSFTLFVPGKPISKARPRFARRGNYVCTYKPSKEKAEEENFIYLVRQQLKALGIVSPIEKGVAVKISCTFCFPLPESYSAKKKERVLLSPYTQKPDLDNLIKFAKDAMNKVVWEDDCQVVMYGPCVKKWATRPGTEILIESLFD